jgi:hypothetical protein
MWKIVPRSSGIRLSGITWTPSIVASPDIGYSTTFLQ